MLRPYNQAMFQLDNYLMKKRSEWLVYCTSGAK